MTAAPLTKGKLYKAKAYNSEPKKDIYCCLCERISYPVVLVKAYKGGLSFPMCTNCACEFEFEKLDFIP